MPVTSETVVNIVCDNSACPGNQLDPHDRSGWMFVNREVYGSVSEQFVYCSQACSATIELEPVPAPPGQPIGPGIPEG